MEVTRRKFVQVIAGAASALGAGLWWIGRKASPRRVVRALHLGKYPGAVVPMEDVRQQSKWSG
jgi:hypothetical protein